MPKPAWMSYPIGAREPGVGRQTVAEVKAYCRVHNIQPVGEWLAKPEYRTGPHPESAFPKLSSKAGPTFRLANQIPLFFPDAVYFWCSRDWERTNRRLGQRFFPAMLETDEAVA